MAASQGKITLRQFIVRVARPARHVPNNLLKDGAFPHGRAGQGDFRPRGGPRTQRRAGPEFFRTLFSLGSGVVRG